MVNLHCRVLSYSRGSLYISNILHIASDLPTCRPPPSYINGVELLLFHSVVFFFLFSRTYVVVGSFQETSCFSGFVCPSELIAPVTINGAVQVQVLRRSLRARLFSHPEGSDPFSPKPIALIYSSFSSLHKSVDSKKISPESIRFEIVKSHGNWSCDFFLDPSKFTDSCVYDMIYHISRFLISCHLHRNGKSEKRSLNCQNK